MMMENRSYDHWFGARKMLEGRPGEAAQLYEQNEVQRALAAFYRDLARHMPQDRVVIVDGVGTIDEVHARVYATYTRAFG